MSADMPKLTVTIGRTTLLVEDIIGWIVEEDASGRGRGDVTIVIMKRFNGPEVVGDHSSALDEAVNDPRRQVQGLSLVQSEVV